MSRGDTKARKSLVYAKRYKKVNKYIKSIELFVERGCLMLAPTVLKDDTTIRRLMRRLLIFCLDWFRDEELGEYDNAVIIVKKGHAPQISYGINSISYRPAKIEIQEKYISTKEWEKINNPRKVTLETLEELFEKYLGECSIKRIKKYEHTVLEIIWPPDFDIYIDDNKEFITGRKSMSKVFCILSVLSKKPDWISAQVSKGSDVFADSLPLGFDEKGIVIYEGKDATYVLRNGLGHSKAQSRKVLLQHKDCLKHIIHNTGYENWKKELEKVLTQP